MRSSATGRIVPALLAAALLVGARSGVAAGEPATGISGVVLNATCPGPCKLPPPPLPVYDGDNLVVVIRRLPERTLVAKLHPKDGTFALATDPGVYRIHAKIVPNAGCWRGSTRRKEVFSGQVTNVRLRVRNLCVV